MSLIRPTDPSRRGGGDIRGDTHAAQIEERRSTASEVVCAGTLACRGCDAPVSTGGRPLALTDELVCPFCSRRGPTRDFLSLTVPTRPARVVVRLSLGR